MFGDALVIEGSGRGGHDRLIGNVFSDLLGGDAVEMRGHAIGGNDFLNGNGGEDELVGRFGARLCGEPILIEMLSLCGDKSALVGLLLVPISGKSAHEADARRWPPTGPRAKRRRG